MVSDDLNIPIIKQPSRLPDTIANFLGKEIEKGTFQAGEKIPTESLLAERFGVSRTVIREALAKLKHDGLLRSKQGSGATVVGPEGTRTFRLDDIDRNDPVALGYLFELRVVLEGSAAYFAAQRRNNNDIEKLEKHLSDMANAVSQNRDATVPDTEFHQSVAHASRNPYLQALMRLMTCRLQTLIRQARSHSSLQRDLPAVVQEEHEAIFEAINLKDPNAARKAIQIHLRNASMRLGLNLATGIESEDLGLLHREKKYLLRHKLRDS